MRCGGSRSAPAGEEARDGPAETSTGGVFAQAPGGLAEDSPHGATGPCRSKRNGGCDESMKLRKSSSRCESCPSKGELAHDGSQPCDDVGDGVGEA